jgi:hypothetical protein
VSPGDSAKTRPRQVRRGLVRAVVAVGAAFILMQAVPYGWRHSNPPVTADAPWPRARADAIARTSCYSCHSNETDWPPYSYVAPVSWLARHDVDDGRKKLNFSEWDHAGDPGDAAERVADGSMPPANFTRLHPDARLTPRERADLIAALHAMDEGGHGANGGGTGGSSGGKDDGPDD